MPKWIKEPDPYDHNKTLKENKTRSRGIIACNKCKTPVHLGAAMWGPDYCAQCNKCDTLYNLGGQELKPKDQWYLDNDEREY